MENNKSVTAVDWLVEEMLATDWWYLSQSMKQDIIEQAKEMEKEQIFDAYNTSFLLRDKPYSTAEKYYEQTYKQ